MTPLQYLTQWRMLLAARWLRQPGVSMAKIATRTSYQSEGAFSKVFKRTTGISPRRYAREQRRELLNQ